MADEAQRRATGATWFETVRARLYGRLLMLLAMGLVFLTLVGVGLIAAWAGILAYAAIVCIAAAVPQTSESADSVAATLEKSTVATSFMALRDGMPAIKDPGASCNRAGR